MSKKKIIEFLIGTDSEFSAFKNNRHIEIDSDDGENETGIDGNGVSLELRCSPSKCPLEVTSNLHKGLITTLKKNKDFFDSHWVAGGYYRGYPTGAHVHIGLGENIINFSTLTRILDSYVGSISLALEERKQGKLRRRAGYGRMGDCRSAAHGGMEYRVMSSFLVSPQITAAMLCLFKIVCDAHVNQNFQFHDFGFTRQDFHNVNREKVKQKFPEIWADIEKMRLYDKYKEYLAIIKYLIENDLSWTPAVSMKQVWGLVNLHQEKKPIKITYKSIWSRWLDKIKGLNLPEVRTGI